MRRTRHEAMRQCSGPRDSYKRWERDGRRQETVAHPAVGPIKGAYGAGSHIDFESAAVGCR